MKDLEEVKDLVERDLSFIKMEGDIMHVDRGLVPNMRVLGNYDWCRPNTEIPSRFPASCTLESNLGSSWRMKLVTTIAQEMYHFFLHYTKLVMPPLCLGP